MGKQNKELDRRRCERGPQTPWEAPVILKLDKIQHLLNHLNLSGWLIYGYRQRNPFAALLTTQQPIYRWLYFLPVTGQAQLICAEIDRHCFQLEAELNTYHSQRELHQLLAEKLHGVFELAMEYSPHGAAAALSTVDAGMIEWIRSRDIVISSSAPLLSLLNQPEPSQLNSKLKQLKNLEKLHGELSTILAQARPSSASIREVDDALKLRAKTLDLPLLESYFIGPQARAAELFLRRQSGDLNASVAKTSTLCVGLKSHEGLELWRTYTFNSPSKAVIKAEQAIAAATQACQHGLLTTQSLPAWQLAQFAQRSFHEHQVQSTFPLPAGQVLSPHGELSAPVFDNGAQRDPRTIPTDTILAIAPALALEDGSLLCSSAIFHYSSHSADEVKEATLDCWIQQSPFIPIKAATAEPSPEPLAAPSTPPPAAQED